MRPQVAANIAPHTLGQHLERTDGTGSTGGSGGGPSFLNAQTETEPEVATASGEVEAFPSAPAHALEQVIPQPAPGSSSLWISDANNVPNTVADQLRERVAQLERELAASQRTAAAFQSEAVAARAHANSIEQAAARTTVALDQRSLPALHYRSVPSSRSCSVQFSNNGGLQTQYDSLLSTHAQTIAECNIARAQVGLLPKIPL
jgi:hypothetical protein